MRSREVVRRLGEGVRLIMVATQFSTRLPLPAVELRAGDLRRASAVFPLVGVVLALVATAVRALVGPWWGPAVATIVAVGVVTAVTGALHEDGLADTADGLWGGEDAGRRLEIMRDSRLGAYGVLALAGALGLRVALLAPLGVGGFARAVICGHVLGRAAMLAAVQALPPAGGWSSEQMSGGPGRAGLAVAGVTSAVAVVAASGLWVLPVVAAAGGVTGLLVWLLRARLGGFSGDALGAVAQVVDLAALAALSALVQQGLL